MADTKQGLRQRYGFDEPNMDEVGDDMVEVTPVQVVEGGEGTEYRYEYGYTGIYFDNAELPVEIKGRAYLDGGVGVWSIYDGSHPVYLVPGDGGAVYGYASDLRVELQKQAYYALSILASRGCVGSWSKVGRHNG